MASLIDLGSAVRELLNGIPTIVEGLRKSYESTIKLIDKVAKRRDMKTLEQVSVAFSKLTFEPDGLSDGVKKYAAKPSRTTRLELEQALRNSQTSYVDAIKSLHLSTAFQARHPELMDLLEKGVQWKQGALSRIVVPGTGIDRLVPVTPTDAQLKDLKKLGPLFAKVNSGIEQIEKEIKTVLAELDRQNDSAAGASAVKSARKAK